MDAYIWVISKYFNKITVFSLFYKKPIGIGLIDFCFYDWKQWRIVYYIIIQNE